ncbi:MAG: DUF3592 domain-containing protein [Sulfurimonadaceae bacterium]
MILFYLLGLLFATIGLYMVLDTYLFRKKARTVTGKVFGYEWRRSKNGRTYQAVIQYRDQGNIYLFKSDIGSSNISNNVNDDVDVLILDNRHSSARLKQMGRPIIAFAFAIMGLISIGVYISTIIETGNSLSLLTVGFFVLPIGVYVLNIFTKQHREKLEHAFSYQRDERGVIGYQPTEEVITNSEFIQKKITASSKISGIVAVVGLALVIFGAYWTYDVKTLIDKAIRTNGTIVSQVSDRGDGQTMYSAIVQFRPYKQDAVRFKDSTSSSHPSWKLGDKVHVYYDPNNVKDAMIDSGLFTYIGQFAMILLGVLLLLFSFWKYQIRDT